MFSYENHLHFFGQTTSFCHFSQMIMLFGNHEIPDDDKIQTLWIHIVRDILVRSRNIWLLKSCHVWFDIPGIVGIHVVPDPVPEGLLKDNPTNWYRVSTRIGSMSSVPVLPVSRGRHKKLVDNFSHCDESRRHVPTRPLHVTSLRLKDPFLFYYCVLRKYRRRRDIFFQSMYALHLPFPIFLSSCILVLATRFQLRLFLKHALGGTNFEC